jgi:nucleotide-binding universal stress UspA family protein
MDIPSIDSGGLTKLLVCTDGSPESQGAYAAALDLARGSGSKVFLLQVVAAIPGYELQPLDLMAPTAQVNLEMVTLMEKAARERLESHRAEAAQQGMDLEVRVRTCPAAYEGILEEAEAIQPNLIIMGRYGRTGLARLLMGSVTARVIGHSPFNVLVVPMEVTLDCKRLLMGSDGSLDSQAAWEEALKISQRTGAVLIAVSVAQGDREVPRAEEIVQKMKASAQRQGVAMETRVLQGRPFEALLQAAQESQINLIILGSHGRTGLSRLLMGSVTERVIGQASCAVLVVKRGRG